MMFVPPASEGAAPSSSSAGRRIVPRASPTKPPRMPTANEITVSRAAFHSRTSDGRPYASSGIFTGCPP